ncbi:adenosylcobinamide-GDP ribazoletransferase, partial [Streptomyces yangpuensis]
GPAGCAAGAGVVRPPAVIARPATARPATVRNAAIAAEGLLRRCVRRFDGVTGDVFGALAEVAATTALIVLALG